jgi:hypothetical protein
MKLAEARSASTDDLKKWGSLASRPLAAMIEVECNARNQPEKLPGLLSFEDIVQYLSPHAGEGELS